METLTETRPISQIGQELNATNEQIHIASMIIKEVVRTEPIDADKLMEWKATIHIARRTRTALRSELEQNKLHANKYICNLPLW